ncbi:MAG: alpha/beta hydrolase [Clostridium sp.]|nr:alpha/beta hydrolase [Clostridium sp.]
MKLRNIIASILALTALAATAADYETTTAIRYSDHGDRCLLDIHHPADRSASLPVVVWFHGGGLMAGEREIPARLREAGYVVVGPGYRLLPQVGVDECIDDAAAAVAWVIDSIAAYGGDPSRIYLTGHSAGGYLTSMVGLDRSRLEPYGKSPDSIAGLIPMSGQAVTHFNHRRQQGLSELTPTIDATAPLFHVRPDAPPYIIITGDRELELYGRYEENAYLWRMMKLAGHPDVHIYELDGYGHDMTDPAFYILKKHIARIEQERAEKK